MRSLWLMKTKVRELRKKSGMTQEQLAERAGITQGYVGMLERGERRLNSDIIEGIARALKVNPSDLIATNQVDEPLVEINSILRTLSAQDVEAVLQYTRVLQKAAQIDAG